MTYRIAALLLSLLTPAVNAQSQIEWDFAIPHKNRCSAGPMMEMNACLAEEYRLSDARLNATYQRLQRELQAPTSLRRAQSAWLRFRDLHCEFHMRKDEPGSLTPYARNACFINLTEKRILDLEQIVPCNGCVLFKPEVYERR